QLFQCGLLIAAPGVNCRQIGYPDRTNPGVLGKGKDSTSSFTFLDRFGAPAEHSVGQAEIAPALRVVGLFASHALENGSGGGEGGLRELLVAEQPSRAPDTKLTRDKSLVKTIGDALGRNKRERLFGFAFIPLHPAANQQWKGDATGCLSAFLRNQLQWLSQVGDVTRLRESIESKQIADKRIAWQDAQSLLIQAPCFRVAAHTLKGRPRFHQHDEVARVQLHGTLEISFSFLPARGSAVHGANDDVKPGLVRQKLRREIQLRQRPIVVTKSVVGIEPL